MNCLAAAFTLRMVALTLAGLPALGLAEPPGAPDHSYLEVSPNDRADLQRLLTTVEEVHDGGMPKADPIIIVLHGPEALAFVRSGYRQNHVLVDRAAKLDAYQLIDVRMCETWMSENDIQRDDLPAFIDTVPYAPEEIRRLEASGYEPYDTVNL